ncbi:MAG: GNAT family N-acetyltransferase [Ancrocorticia sp.]
MESDETGSGTVIGFAAYRLTESRVTIEYIATSETTRGRGLGTQLVRELQHLHPGTAIFAQTDDDAIGFYRSLGFAHSGAPRDARWPERPRYDCLLTSEDGTPPTNCEKDAN